MENAELPEDEEKKSVDPRLEGIVNKMFQRCLGDHKYKQAIGIALETRRLDIFEKTILESVCLIIKCLDEFSERVCCAILILIQQFHLLPLCVFHRLTLVVC